MKNFEAENAHLRETIQFLRDTLKNSIEENDEPNTVVTPDDVVHSGPLADYLHLLFNMIIEVLEDALDKDFTK